MGDHDHPGRVDLVDILVLMATTALMMLCLGCGGWAVKETLGL